MLLLQAVASHISVLSVLQVQPQTFIERVKRNTGTQTLKSEVVTTELLWLKLHTLERLIQTIEVDLNIRTEAFLYVNIPTRTRWPNSLQNLVENFSTWTNLSIMCSSLRAASITNAIFRQGDVPTVQLIASVEREYLVQNPKFICGIF